MLAISFVIFSNFIYTRHLFNITSGSMLKSKRLILGCPVPSSMGPKELAVSARMEYISVQFIHQYFIVSKIHSCQILTGIRKVLGITYLIWYLLMLHSNCNISLSYSIFHHRTCCRVLVQTISLSHKLFDQVIYIVSKQKLCQCSRGYPSSRVGNSSRNYF